MNLHRATFQILLTLLDIQNGVCDIGIKRKIDVLLFEQMDASKFIHKTYSNSGIGWKEQELIR